MSAPANIHALWLRTTHWINAVAVVLMATSGWRIYNAAPFWPFTIRAGATLGGWLGGALQWHFAAMWLLAGNGLAYLLVNVLTGRLRRQFFPVTPRQFGQDVKAALRGKLSHADPRHYNAVQRVAYRYAAGAPAQA